jgi:2-hydroxy-3-oxopropionate reductase
MVGAGYKVQAQEERPELSAEKIACGFVGLGVMGLPMARNLLRAGFELTVYNRSPGRTEQLESEGAVSVSSPRAVAERAQIVLTCLSSPDAVKEVVMGNSGVLEGAKPGMTFIDHSTIDPATARDVAQACRERGVAALDAPVSGGEQGAINGNLSIMVGGDEDSFQSALPVLNAMGATVRHVGPSGAGQTVKAANQMIVGGTIGVVAEALLLLEAQGVALAPALEVLGGGLAGSAVLDAKGKRMLARDFAPGAKAKLQVKDLTIALNLAHEAGVPVPITAITAQLFEAMIATGRSDLDHGGLFALLAELAGRPSS